MLILRRDLFFITLLTQYLLVLTNGDGGSQSEEIAARKKIPSDWATRSGGEHETKKGDLGGGCLAKSTVFPTVDLNPTLGYAGFKPGKTNIRINKFYAVRRDRFFVQNTGLGTMSIKFEHDALQTEATIRGDNWDDEYVLAKADVYWSLDNNYGAQHAISKQTYALEIQLVHFAKGLGSLKAAAAKTNGLRIISIMFEAVGHQNPWIEPISRAAFSVGFPSGKWHEVHGPLDIKRLFPSNLAHYTYTGRYLSEPCGNVKFIVFHHPVPVSYKQLDRIRMLMNSEAKLVNGVFEPEFSDKGQVDFSKHSVHLTIVNEAVLGKATVVLPSPAFHCISVLVASVLLQLRSY